MFCAELSDNVNNSQEQYASGISVLPFDCVDDAGLSELWPEHLM